MKLYNTIAAAFFAVSAITASGAADANVVNASGSNVDLNTVAVGQSGTITNIYSDLFSFPPNVVGQGSVVGFIPSMSKITFTYHFSPSLSQADILSYGSYAYNQGGNSYNGSSVSDTGNGSNIPAFHQYLGFTNGTPSLMLAWTAANLNTNGSGVTGGTASIQNNSNGLVNFTSLFSGILRVLPARGNASITYNVSAIPLPASLPLFGAVMLGMFGFARYRNRKNAAFVA